MPREIMLETLNLAAVARPELVDLTGGEPVLWPHLQEFIELSVNMPTRVRVQTNLDALLLPESDGIAELLARHGVEILASMPETLEGRTIGGCIEALRHLSDLGYGDLEAGALPLDIAYNPLPGQLPGDEKASATQFRSALEQHGIAFGSFFSAANVALGGFADWLDGSDETERYRELLCSAFDAETLPNLPCRHGVAIAWDGRLFDCDYNIAAGVPLADGPQHVSEHANSPVGQTALATRRITFSDHCFACAVQRGGVRS
jgi:radical SAM/Cys-rich protein